MKRCSKDLTECIPACDFCHNLKRKKKDSGESFCTIKKMVVDWGDWCKDFDCFRNYISKEQKEDSEKSWKKLVKECRRR